MIFSPVNKRELVLCVLPCIIPSKDCSIYFVRRFACIMSFHLFLLYAHYSLPQKKGLVVYLGLFFSFSLQSLHNFSLKDADVEHVDDLTVCFLLFNKAAPGFTSSWFASVVEETSFNSWRL